MLPECRLHMYLEQTGFPALELSTPSRHQTNVVHQFQAKVLLTRDSLVAGVPLDIHVGHSTCQVCTPTDKTPICMLRVLLAAPEQHGSSCCACYCAGVLVKPDKWPLLIR